MKIMRKNSGFTMIELFITMAVMGILAATAIPQLMVIIPNYELRSVARDVFSHFQLAKLMAAKRNAPCVISFTKNARNEVNGYVIFLDTADRNFELDLDAEEPEQVIASVDWSEKRDKGVRCDDVNFSGSETIAFSPNGIPIGPGGGFVAGTVKLSNKNGLETDVVVSKAGNVRIERVK